MNWNDIQFIKRTEERLTKLGYKMMPPRYGGEISVYPLDDKNSIYSRDADVFSGTVEQIACWIRGVEHQDGYLKMLKATSDARIRNLEEKYKKELEHQAMLDLISNPDKKIDKHTKDLMDAKSK
jgi:hypothetical protein